MWLSHFIEKNLYIKTCIYKINFLKFLILSHFKSSQWKLDMENYSKKSKAKVWHFFQPNDSISRQYVGYEGVGRGQYLPKKNNKNPIKNINQLQREKLTPSG